MSVNSNTKIQFKRSTVAGLAPNTVSSSNGNYIYPGQIALNLTDKKAYSSNGTHSFEFGSNLSSLSVYGNTILRENTTLTKLIANNALGSSQILASNSTGGLYWKSENEITSGDLIMTEFSDPATINAFLRANAGKTIYLQKPESGYYELNTLTNTPVAGEVVEIPPYTNLIGVGGVVEIRPNNPSRGAFAFMNGADHIEIRNIKVEFDYGCERLSLDFKREDDVIVNGYRSDYWWSRDPYTFNALYANGTPLGLDANINNAAPGPYKLWVDAWNAAHSTSGQINIVGPFANSKIKEAWADAGYTELEPYRGFGRGWNRNAGFLIYNSNYISFYNCTANNCLVQFNIQGGSMEDGTSQSTDIYIDKMIHQDDIEFGCLARQVNNLTIDELICDTVGMNRNHAEPHSIYCSNEPTVGNKSTNVTIKSVKASKYQPGSVTKFKCTYNLKIGEYQASDIQVALSLGNTTGSISSISIDNQRYSRTVTEDQRPVTSTFDGSSSSNVIIASDTLNLGTNPYSNGDPVFYDAGVTGTNVGGLSSGSQYFVINASSSSVKLTTVKNVPANTVNITSLGSGTAHRLIKAVYPIIPSATNEYTEKLTAKGKSAPEYLINMNDSAGFTFGPIRVTQRPSKSAMWYGEEEYKDDRLRLFDAENCKNLVVTNFILESARLTDGAPQIRLRTVDNSYFGPGVYINKGRNHNRDDVEYTIIGNTYHVNTTSYAITYPNHDLIAGDVVLYSKEDNVSPLTGLVDEGLYYIRDETSSTFKLSLIEGGSVLPITAIPVDGVGSHLFTRSKANPKLYEIASSTNDGGSASYNKIAPVRIYNADWGLIAAGSSYNTIEIDKSMLSRGYIEGTTIDQSMCLGDSNQILILDGKRVVDVDVSTLTDNEDRLQTSGKSGIYLLYYYERDDEGDFETEPLGFPLDDGDSITIGNRTYNFVDRLNYTSSNDQILIYDNITNVDRATTGNISLNGNISIDGTNAANTDRILVKDQTDQTKNGIYYGNTAGLWARASDASTWAGIQTRKVYVEEGPTHANTYWIGPSGEGSVGSTNITFTLLDPEDDFPKEFPEKLLGDRNMTRLSAAIRGTNVSSSGNGVIYISSGPHSQVDVDANGDELFIVAKEKGALASPIDISAVISDKTFTFGRPPDTYTDTYTGEQVFRITSPTLIGAGELDKGNLSSIRRYDTTDNNITVSLPKTDAKFVGYSHILQKLSSYNSLIIKSESGTVLKRLYDDEDYVECIMADEANWIVNFYPKNSLPTIDVSIPWNTSLIDLAGSKTEYVAQGTELKDVIFSADGQKMYTINDNQNRIRQYSLSTPWDISSATYGTNAENSYDASALDTTVNGLAINDSGNTFYVVGDINNKIYELRATTPYVVNSSNMTVPTGASFNVSSEATVLHSVAFSSTGSKMFVLNKTPSEIFEYSLSTPWWVNTATYSTRSLSLVSEETGAHGMFFKPDGTRVYVVGSGGLTIDEYSLGTAWQIDTGLYVRSANSTFNSSRIPHGVAIKSDGSTLYAAVANGSSNSYIQQYSFLLPSNTYNVSAKYSGKTLVVSSTSGINVAAGVINSDEVGTKVDIIRAGAGTITVVGNGVTVNKAVASANLRAQYSLATITYNATNSIIVSGDLG
jgi:sugar lactone lactonase YvrE